MVTYFLLAQTEVGNQYVLIISYEDMFLSLHFQQHG